MVVHVIVYVTVANSCVHGPLGFQPLLGLTFCYHEMFASKQQNKKPLSSFHFVPSCWWLNVLKSMHLIVTFCPMLTVAKVQWKMDCHKVNGTPKVVIIINTCKKCQQFITMNNSTSVMIYHCGTSLSEQHTDLLCTKQDLSHTSRYVDESSPEIARYCICMPTARPATLSVTTYA